MTAVLETYGRGNGRNGLRTAVGMAEPEGVWNSEYRSMVLAEPWSSEHGEAQKVQNYIDRGMRALERYMNGGGDSGNVVARVNPANILELYPDSAA